MNELHISWYKLMIFIKATKQVFYWLTTTYPPGRNYPRLLTYIELHLLLYW